METVNHKIRRLIRYYEHLTGSRDPVTIARVRRDPDCSITVRQYFWKLQTFKKKTLDFYK